MAGLIGIVFGYLDIRACMAMDLPVTMMPFISLSYYGASLWASMIAVDILREFCARCYRI
jgi:cell division protein FtsW (lipid II flippase)